MGNWSRHYQQWKIGNSSEQIFLSYVWVNSVEIGEFFLGLYYNVSCHLYIKGSSERGEKFPATKLHQ